MGNYNETHRHGERTGQGGGGGKKKKQQGLGSLSDVTSVTTGKDLVKLARAMARAEVKPQIRAYRRLVKELKGQQAADTVGLERLGQQTQKDITGAANAYDVGAQGATARTQAVGNLLQGQLQQQGQQAAASQQTAQTGVLGGLTEGMALQGAPQGGEAQAALGQLVQQQNARQAAEAQASQTFASSQQGSYGGLLEGMRTAGGLQASTSKQAATRDIASRIAEMRLQAGQDIREAAGKKADVKATKGDIMLTKLAELRSAERDYDLGRRATRTDKRGQDISAATAAAAQAETARHNQASESTAQQNADTAAENAANDSGGHEGRAARKKEARQISTLARDFISTNGVPQTPRQVAKLRYYLLHQEGISNATLVNRILDQIIANHQQSGPSGGGPQHGGNG